MIFILNCRQSTSKIYVLCVGPTVKYNFIDFLKITRKHNVITLIFWKEVTFVC